MNLISWNVWGMISNPNFLTSPSKCIADVIDQNFDINKINQKKNRKNLIILLIQECWIFYGFFVSENRFISFPVYIISLLIPLFYYYKANPINNINSLLEEKSLHIYQDSKINAAKYTNSGLLMITNQKADSEGYNYFSKHKSIDSIASKGFMWIIYESYKLIIINLHLQSEKYHKIKYEQLDEIRSFIDKFKKKNYYIYIGGDFNLNIKNYNVKKKILNIFDNMLILTNYQATTNNNNCYDFFLTNFIPEKYVFKNIKNQLSDHDIIKLKIFDS